MWLNVPTRCNTFVSALQASVSTLDNGNGSESASPWTRSRDGGSTEPQLQQQEQASSTRRQLDFAEPRMGVFDFVSQVWMQPGSPDLHTGSCLWLRALGTVIIDVRARVCMHAWPRPEG